MCLVDAPPLEQGADLGAAMEPELVEDVGNVALSGGLGDHQFGGDLAVGVARRDQRGDLSFARGEWVRAGRARRVRERFVERLVNRERPPLGDRGSERLVLEPSPERRQVGPKVEPL